MKKYRDGQRELHCIFVFCFSNCSPVVTVVLYKDVYSGRKACYIHIGHYDSVKTVVSYALEFKEEVRLHQGPAASTFLLAVVMGRLMDEVRQETPWTIIFVDDAVICSMSRRQMGESKEVEVCPRKKRKEG